MSAGSARLNHAVRTLRERWEDTKGHWKDQVAHDFEKNHLIPIEHQSKVAMQGMEKLAEVIVKMRRDCS